MSYFRNLGALIKSKVKNTQEFVNLTGYSKKDAGRIFDGRLFLSPSQLIYIGDKIGLSLENLLNINQAKSIRYIGEFTNKANEELLLDYIDRYIDLIESIK